MIANSKEHVVATDVYKDTIYGVTRALFQLQVPSQPLAVAVSGGADSMCLCLLLHEWAQVNGTRVIALTVDHLLREDSTTEALQVQKWLNARGIEHHTLTWHKEGRPTNLQESARKARYALLTDWCEGNDIHYLALAHNQDDQIETIIQRLAHQSGQAGLAGIPDLRELDKVKIIRPLLNISKTDIIGTLHSLHQPWIEDPSNHNQTFTRVKIRNSPWMKDHRLKENLLSFRNRMAERRMAIESEAKSYCDLHLQLYQEGYCELDQEQFKNLEREVQDTILAAILQMISGKDYPVGYESLKRLHEQLFTGHKLSCHGCLLQAKNGRLIVCREANNIQDATTKLDTHTVLWDQRFKITLPEEDLRVQKIGYRWLDFKENAKMMALPEAVRPTLPGIWQKERLLNVPHLAYYGSLELASECKLLFYPALHICRSRFIFS